MFSGSLLRLAILNFNSPLLDQIQIRGPSNMYDNSSFASKHKYYHRTLHQTNYFLNFRTFEATCNVRFLTSCRKACLPSPPNSTLPINHKIKHDIGFRFLHIYILARIFLKQLRSYLHYMRLITFYTNNIIVMYILSNLLPQFFIFLSTRLNHFPFQNFLLHSLNQKREYYKALQKLL